MRWRSSQPEEPALAGLGTRAEGILRMAEERAEECRAAARREAEEILAAARRGGGGRAVTAQMDGSAISGAPIRPRR